MGVFFVNSITKTTFSFGRPYKRLLFDLLESTYSYCCLYETTLSYAKVIHFFIPAKKNKKECSFFSNFYLFCLFQLEMLFQHVKIIRSQKNALIMKKMSDSKIYGNHLSFRRLPIIVALKHRFHRYCFCFLLS